MPKKSVSRIDRNLARRLREARREIGQSTRGVASRLPSRLTVSHATIASYENGTSVPPIDVLAALASIYQRTLNWFLEDRSGLSDFRYRNLKARIRLGDKRQFEALAGKWVDAYVNLERHLNVALRRKITELGDAETAPRMLASILRKELGADDADPIQNVVSLLESLAVRVLELRPTLQLDTLTARHADETVVIVNPDIRNDRLRLTLAHEVAHALFGSCKGEMGWSDEIVEAKAYDFASELLLPESQLVQAFEGKSFLRLIQYRERFGVSLASMIFRAEKSRIIPTTTSRRLWSEIVERGWKHEEPGFVWRDRAIRFETLMESALHTGKLTWTDAERVTGIQEIELRRRIIDITDYCGIVQAGESRIPGKTEGLRLVTD